MSTPKIETYLLPTGYYDTAKIREDAGMNSRAAAFLDIFGSFDDDGKDTGGDLPGEWQALLDEANRRNDAFYAAGEQANEQEARDLVGQPEPWGRETWKRLVKLGYATRLIDTGSETGYGSVTYELTERGERLLNPSYRALGLYADQVEP